MTRLFVNLILNIFKSAIVYELHIHAHNILWYLYVTFCVYVYTVAMLFSVVDIKVNNTKVIINFLIGLFFIPIKD